MASDRIAVGELAASVGGRVVGDPSVQVADVTHDSREAGSDVLYVAVRGLTRDGHDFIDAAVAGGCRAVCVDHDVTTAEARIVVADTRRAMAALAARVHGDPSHRLRVVGVTGTNGKTTVTHMLESIATSAGLRSGLMGTVGVRIAGEPFPAVRTTPESTDLQRILRGMADRDVDLVALEVSSHALALHRVAATAFALVAFTNLSRDHLDFHRDLEDYFAAKASLFTAAYASRGVVWTDDPWGDRLATGSPIRVVTVGSGDQDVRVVEPSVSTTGSSFTLMTRRERARIRVPLPGRFNIANAAVAAACALELGIDPAAIREGLAGLAPIPGRFEPVPCPFGFAVIVDYAHTPDAVAAVIAEAATLASGRVLAVLGAGGDRDREKRPMMGRAMAAADVAVVTSDNPRSEDPDAIIAAVAGGARQVQGATVVEEPDRRGAIRWAVAAARPGDVVLVLGKGHEQGQELADRTIPFDDRDEAGAAIAAIAARREAER